MTTMIIKDLEQNKELDQAAMKHVSGGFNFGAIGGQLGDQFVAGGGILSPVTAVNVPVNVPVVIQLDLDPTTLVDFDVNNIIASAGTAVA